MKNAMDKNSKKKHFSKGTNWVCRLSLSLFCRPGVIILLTHVLFFYFNYPPSLSVMMIFHSPPPSYTFAFVWGEKTMTFWPPRKLTWQWHTQLGIFRQSARIKLQKILLRMERVEFELMSWILTRQIGAISEFTVRGRMASWGNFSRLKYLDEAATAAELAKGGIGRGFNAKERENDGFSLAYSCHIQPPLRSHMIMRIPLRVVLRMCYQC